MPVKPAELVPDTRNTRLMIPASSRTESKRAAHPAPSGARRSTSERDVASIIREGRGVGMGSFVGTARRDKHASEHPVLKKSGEVCVLI